MSPKYAYKFSVITAVYNTEEYVADAIESVLNQTIGFEDNVQLILVNDGSKDRSGEICKEYRDKYPNNIVYIEQENRGVSSARNRGLEKVEGKYVNFLDSDDKLSENALEEVWGFFEDHYDEIDFVSIPIHYFEGSDKEHILNFKFHDTQVIDIKEKPSYIQLSSASTFFKASTLKNYSFDESLKYAEDVKLINEILLEKQKYGVLNTAKYLYRKRLGEDSAMQQTTLSKNWYFNVLKDSSLYLIDLCEKKFKDIPLYYQHLIMYDLQFRIKVKEMSILNEKEKKDYISILKTLLQHIDEKVVFSQKHYHQEHMIFALSLKYNKTIEQIANEIEIRKGKAYFRNIEFPRASRLRLNIKNFDLINGKLEIEGVIKTILPINKLDLFVPSIKGKTDIDLIRYRHADAEALERKVLKGHRFSINVPVSETDEIKFEGTFRGKRFNTYYYFDKGLESQYIVDNNSKKLISFRGKRIFIKKYSFFNHAYYELKYFKTLLKSKKFKVLSYRILYRIFNVLKFRKLWLIMERPTKAGDNAQAFFEYATQTDDNIKKVFVLSKDSEDFDNIQDIGKVVDWKSVWHLMYILSCDKLISSHADGFIINPFGRWGKYFTDLYTYDFIFLQHGIIKDDLSGWLNKLDKGFRLFITSAKPEYKSILDYDYLYTKDEVLLSGLPRFDKLENKPQKKILIMPTWRQFLTVKANSLGVRGNNPNFTKSEFFQFYNSLINNKKLLDKVGEKGYKIKLCLHPAMISEAETFEENDLVEISKDICDYSKEFCTGSILITDYSSVAFDFAYLRKPVIYTQFDYEDVFSNHIYDEGYFDYRRDGLGPVCEDLDSTVEEIYKSIENDCKLEKRYRERIDNFFEFDDRNNSKRVYEAIRKL